jgi:hypothetical protein
MSGTGRRLRRWLGSAGQRDDRVEIPLALEALGPPIALTSAVPSERTFAP